MKKSKTTNPDGQPKTVSKLVTGGIVAYYVVRLVTNAILIFRFRGEIKSTVRRLLNVVYGSLHVCACIFFVRISRERPSSIFGFFFYRGAGLGEFGSSVRLISGSR